MREVLLLGICFWASVFYFGLIKTLTVFIAITLAIAVVIRFTKDKEMLDA